MEADELVGRDVELGALSQRLSDAQAGRGGVVLVGGEAGIGKSTLATVIAARARAAGFRVELGRAWELAEAPAWFPLRGCLRALSIDTSQLPASDAQVFGLWEQVLEALARACAQAPILWLIGDLHAADARSLDLLGYLAQPSRGLPFLIIGTVRTGDARVQGPVLDRLTRLSRDGGRLDLLPLGASDAGRVVARVSGQTLSARTLGDWMARTGGNPLFLVECARALRAGGSSAGKPPATVVQVVLERMRALPRETQELLELGAVLDNELSASTLGRMCERMPAAVIDGLLPALRSGLLLELSPGSFRFGHALVREAIHDALEPDRRRRAHERAEAALAQLPHTPERLAERAWHALDALGVLSEERVLKIVREAIAMLVGQGAQDRAYRLWRRYDEVRSTPPEAVELIEGTRLAMGAGAYAEAQRHGQAALALARERQQATCYAEAALALGANLQPATVDMGLVQALERALVVLGTDEPKLACLVRARLAAALQPTIKPLEPVEMGRAAIAEARALGDPTLLREVLFFAGAALCDYVPMLEAKAVASDLLELGQAAGDQERTLRALVRRTVVTLELGDWPAFEVDCERMLALARSAGHPRLVWRPLLVASMRAISRGRFEESERLLEEVEELGRLTDDPALRMSLGAHRILRSWSLDRRAEGERGRNAMNPALASGPSAYHIRPAMNALFALRFEVDEILRDELPNLSDGRFDGAGSPGLIGIAGEAIARVGTREQCAGILGSLLSFAGRQLCTGHVPYSHEGPMDRVLALLEARLGNSEQALARISAAIEQAAAHGLEPWVARMRLDRGRMLAGLSRAREAENDFVTCAALSKKLGLLELMARAEAAGTHTKAVPAAPPAPIAAATFGLEREGEVWRVSWGARETRVRDSRGMSMLARLVAAPNERIHALVLAGSDEGTLVEGDAGDMLDPSALKSYRARLSELANELEQAEAHADLGRVARLQQEQEAIEAELSRAVGLAGRSRKAGSITERARVNATRRIKDAVARIGEAEPELGRYLEAAVRTGAYCSYRP